MTAQIMKAAAILLTLMTALNLGVGQLIIHNPGVVSFQNTETARPPGQPATFHLIYLGFGVVPLVGTQYQAELYYFDTVPGAMVAIPESISHFKASTTSTPGTWSGPAAPVAFPPWIGGVDYFNDGTGETGDGSGTGAGYYPVTLAVRVW